MDLDLWHCFGRKKLCLITKEIRYGLLSDCCGVPFDASQNPVFVYLYILKLTCNKKKTKKTTFNPFALRTAKTLWSFDHSECNRVKEFILEQILPLWLFDYQLGQECVTSLTERRYE